MKAIVNTGLGSFSLDVKDIDDCFNQLPEKPNATHLNSCGLNFIITASGTVYISDNTPGYCDGENRIFAFLD